MNFIRDYLTVHIRDNFFYYIVLTFIFTWNYFLLPNTIPFFMYNGLTGLLGETVLNLLFSNLAFIFILSLLFIYPNKVVVQLQGFKEAKHKKMFFWICQLISLIIVIFTRQVYEIFISILM